MKTVDKCCWIAFLIVTAMITCGILFHDSPFGAPLLFVGYVFGLPFLLMPLFALQKWSEDRKRRKEESEQANAAYRP
jgi:uncharacterized YccA/Bax inhibitor family protein